MINEDNFLARSKLLSVSMHFKWEENAFQLELERSPLPRQSLTSTFFFLKVLRLLLLIYNKFKRIKNALNWRKISPHHQLCEARQLPSSDCKQWKMKASALMIISWLLSARVNQDNFLYYFFNYTNIISRSALFHNSFLLLLALNGWLGWSENHFHSNATSFLFIKRDEENFYSWKIKPKLQAHCRHANWPRWSVCMHNTLCLRVKCC